MAKFNVGRLFGKAKEVADKSGDKIASGVDKVTDKIDDKTGGKYHDKLEKIDGLASKLDKTAKPEGETVAPATDAEATPSAPTGEAPPTTPEPA